MFTQIQMKNGLLNVAQLQEKVDQIIFDYIDTSQNWGKAFKALNNLFQQTVTFYENYVDEKNGLIPDSTVYWSLFMDVVSRLTYFKTLAQKQLVLLDDLVIKEELLDGYSAAANCLVNLKTFSEQEFLDEISASYEEIELLDGVKGKFKQSIIEQNNTLKDCLTFFYHFSKSYNNVN